VTHELCGTYVILGRKENMSAQGGTTTMTTVGGGRPTTVRQSYTIAGIFGTAAGLGLVPGALLLLSELVRGSYDPSTSVLWPWTFLGVLLAFSAGVVAGFIKLVDGRPVRGRLVVTVADEALTLRRRGVVVDIIARGAVGLVVLQNVQGFRYSALAFVAVYDPGGLLIGRWDPQWPSGGRYGGLRRALGRHGYPWALGLDGTPSWLKTLSKRRSANAPPWTDDLLCGALGAGPALGARQGPSSDSDSAMRRLGRAAGRLADALATYEHAAPSPEPTTDSVNTEPYTLPIPAPAVMDPRPHTYYHHLWDRTRSFRLAPDGVAYTRRAPDDARRVLAARPGLRDRLVAYTRRAPDDARRVLAARPGLRDRLVAYTRRAPDDAGRGRAGVESGALRHEEIGLITVDGVERMTFLTFYDRRGALLDSDLCEAHARPRALLRRLRRAGYPAYTDAQLYDGRFMHQPYDAAPRLRPLPRPAGPPALVAWFIRGKNSPDPPR